MAKPCICRRKVLDYLAAPWRLHVATCDSREANEDVQLMESGGLAGWSRATTLKECFPCIGPLGLKRCDIWGGMPHLIPPKVGGRCEHGSLSVSAHGLCIPDLRMKLK